ncbi:MULTISPECIES: holo-ACP synthase [Cohnella]|uniref:Holo-[acyl-carrier-protein] synthase n=1 Tax=Cohnella phaseoli TaxID=456490 RepID=A0A3D9INN0_9BACL|nr:holo-ACP synthase [Cohnella phaseoli]RED63372.1 holo-[acyl-carrier-protein] synthase [Cohnella phaseoli]
MIVGIGLDIVETERMAKILAGRSAARFIDRVLTPAEREVWGKLPPRRALEYASGRFAAKEAVVKALGCGIGATAGFQDIEIIADELGKPVCKLSSAAVVRLGWDRPNYRLHIAITHERSVAAATALIEKL